MQTYRFQVVIEQDEDGLFIAECPALKGCYTQGRTFEEAVERIREVIQVCVRELQDEGAPIETRFPEIVGLKTVEIAA